MMRRIQRLFSLEAADGTVLGTVHAVVSYRTSEETKEDDLLRATETALALIPARDAPDGGFLRGMVLARGAARYRMLVPVQIGRLWRIKCERVYTEEGIG